MLKAKFVPKKHKKKKRITRKDRERILFIKTVIFILVVINVGLFYGRYWRPHRLQVKAEQRAAEQKKAEEEALKKEIASREWTITEYGDPEAPNQAMCYSILDKDGNLTMIDGGWDYDEEDVRKIISDNGNHVVNWIITHPHPDHVGAFNAIYSDPQGITIDHIYTIELDYNAYQAKATQVDEFPVYEKFLELAGNMPELTYVHIGDELDIMDLKMEVMNAYTDEVDEQSEDICNDASMVFTLTGNQQKMLFLADVGKARNDFLITNYKEQLPSDYLQMGHHGNSDLSAELYKTVNPQVAFFDAPDWLMYPGEDSIYTTPDYTSLMTDMGVTVYCFDGAPHSVVLK